MAIYHLSAKVITRGAGHSAVHAAAYRARADLTDERTGLKHDYSRKSGDVLFSGIYAPKDAPEWAHDRAQLWNHVEAFEKHRRAELAREYEIALFPELTLEQNRQALQDLVRENFTRRGLIADVNIHAPSKDGDQRNIHAHIMVVTRKLDGSEFVRTKERFEKFSEKEAAKKAELEKLRMNWERIGNRHLERHGHQPTLDHRSLQAQGIERAPTIHQGKAATALERKGKASELGTVNREIAAANTRVIDLAAERAMRQARDAAKGRVDDIRPVAHEDHARDTAAEIQRAQQEAFASVRGRRDDVRPPTEATQWHTAAQEAAQRPERSEGRETRAGQQRASQAPEIAPAAASEPERDITRGTERAVGGFFGGFARVAERVLGGLFSFFAGDEPKVTPQQAHDRAQAAGNVETQHAQSHEAAQQEGDARLQRTLDEIRRTETDRQAAPEYFRTITRPINRGRDRDDDGHERERERDRGYER